MYEVTSAVAYMRRQNPPIINRDIKLLNILLKKEDDEIIVKLADFGDSKTCGSGSTLEHKFYQRRLMDTECGTPYFMAPEITMHLKYDASVDTFALGLVHLVILQSGKNQILIPLSGIIFIIFKLSYLNKFNAHTARVW